MASMHAIDRRFFDRYPEREYRGRPAFSKEVELEARLRPLPSTPPAGARFFTLVRRVAPGVLSHLIIAVSNTDNEPWLELPEDVSREWYEHAVMEMAGMPEVLH
jgi:hypothetical protein